MKFDSLSFPLMENWKNTYRLWHSHKTNTKLIAYYNAATVYGWFIKYFDKFSEKIFVIKIFKHEWLSYVYATLTGVIQTFCVFDVCRSLYNGFTSVICH